MYTEYSPLTPKFHSVSLYDQPFSGCRLVEIGMHQMTLIPEVSKIPRVHRILTPEAQIALHFAPRLLIFHIIEVFGFRIGYNGEIKQEAQGLGLTRWKTMTT